MRLLELREKEVINVCTCRSIGCVADVIFNTCSGCIEYLIVPGPCKFCGLFGHDTEFIIPWNCIQQIGPDIILVQINEDECRKKCE